MLKNIKSCINSITLAAIATFTPFSVIAETSPTPITFPVSTFTLEGDSPLPASQTQALLDGFADKEYGLADLQAVSQQVEQAIRDAGFAFYRVVLPAQNVADGEVTLKVVSFALAEVALNGNHFFDELNILNSLPHLQKGVSPNTQTLAHQIKVANHHPNKDLTVVFRQSKTVDKVDAKIDINETKPYQFALITNNTGTHETGKVRISGAFQHSNLWNKDHIANVSYTTSPTHTRDVSQYAVSYSLPLYKFGGWLNAYYTYSDVNTGRVAITGGDLDVSGSGEMFGLSYRHYLHKMDSYEHSLSIGFDNRFFENNADLTLGAVRRGDISPDIRSTPLTLTYQGNWVLDSLYIGHHISWAKNLRIGSLNNQDAYDELAFATGQQLDEDWDVFRYGLFANKSFNNWLLRASLKGQYSDESLISGEQFGLGGVYSVRGYEEREVSSDIGYFITFEAHTPKWNNLNLIAFYDYGEGHNRDALPNVKDSWNLASVGVGLRWQYKTYIQARVDLARTLHDGNETAQSQHNMHASVSLFY
jgi:hemolysin activation/secretion protein